ncbi:hypothetical protein KIW84_044892 [Lathyrus oleraceus]|uniref:Uncharacterized protein n=1 Tax=Pisum sativum TaxID=3888 RepID=A0A9D4XLQ2_PEA|nr:hypothetical protein KIW84_044892 [Pisum sativum]
MNEMVYDAIRKFVNVLNVNANMENETVSECEVPNEEAQRFYDVLTSTNQPIYEGASEFRLSISVNDDRNGTPSPYVKALALGPNPKGTSRNISFLNGYKFHTEGCSRGKKGHTNGEENDFYGRITQIRHKHQSSKIDMLQGRYSIEQRAIEAKHGYWCYRRAAARYNEHGPSNSSGVMLPTRLQRGNKFGCATMHRAPL